MEATLVNPNPSGFIGFGFSVAIENDLLAIGAPESDSFGGRAVLYKKSGNDWLFVTELVTLQMDTMGSNTAGSQYGFSVAIDETLVIVGRPELLQTPPGPGEVHVFQFQVNQYSFLQQPDTESSDGGFGYALSASEGVVAASALSSFPSVEVFEYSGDSYAQLKLVTPTDTLFDYR